VESANFTVSVPHSLGVKAAVEKLQGAGGGQVSDMELIEVTAKFRAKVAAGFSLRDVTGVATIDISHVGVVLDVSGWVPAMVNGLVKSHIEAELKKALE
jgi:hypothetical protein